MADSDNSMTLPLVTRRTVLVGPAIAIAEWQSIALASGDLETSRSRDLAVAVWRQWRDAHNLTEQLCRQQQRLERKLIETIGFPCATIQLSNCETVTLYSLETLRDVFFDPVDTAVSAKAEADFKAHQARWDTADKEIGYSAALRDEREAADRAAELLEVLSETPAASPAGVAAKLDAVLREGQSSKDDAEFPWPQIRSALEDIIRIGQQIDPN